MGSTDPHAAQMLGVLVILVLIVVAGWLAYQRTLSRRLEHRFGAEYHRAVDTLGSRTKAEAELRSREKRVEGLHIVALHPAQAAEFAQRWEALQSRFVDDPRGALGEADRLVREVMLQRGYPMADFEARAADISVDHPAVVDHYRAAQTILLRNQPGQAADTEDLRQAVVHFRALFNELLEVDRPTPTSGPRVEVRP
jgi:hypothetical protein